MEGISRIDSDDTHGWFVRVYYKTPKVHRKFFSDSIWGGKEKALERAKEYRVEYVRKYPPPKKLPYKREPIASNTSGVNGVSETFVRSRTGRKIPCFCVFWAPRRNERRCKKFYHHKHDSREAAFEAAVEFRKEREKEILRLHKAGKR